MASWLALTAKAHEYPADLLTNKPPALQQPKSSRLKGQSSERAEGSESPAGTGKSIRRRTQVQVHGRHQGLHPLAEWIASRRPPVAVPSAFASVIDRVIKVRSNFADDITSHGLEADDGSNQRHSYFVSILEKVREVLRPRMPAGVAKALSRQPPEPEHLANMFAALKVYEPADVADSPSIPLERPTTEEAKDGVVYEAERETSIVDAISIYGMMWADLQRIRDRIRWIWSSYRAGVFDAAPAAIATNTAIDLARNLIEEVLAIFQPHTVWKVAQKFFFAHCLYRGFAIQDLLGANGQPNPDTYDIRDDVFMVAYNLLNGVVKVLGPNLPLYKDGTYGTYDPRRDRTKMSGQERFQEDLIVLSEMFSELVTVGRQVHDYPIQDELLRGIKEMDRTREVPFHLVFSAQVVLDIHHLLREDAARPFNQMMEQIALMGESLEQAEFHKGLKFDNWPPENDRVLQEIGRRIPTLDQPGPCLQDQAEDVLACHELLDRRGRASEPYTALLACPGWLDAL